MRCFKKGHLNNVNLTTCFQFFSAPNAWFDFLLGDEVIKNLQDNTAVNKLKRFEDLKYVEKVLENEVLLDYRWSSVKRQ